MVINLHGHLTNYIESRRPLSHATVPPDQLSQKDEQIIYNSIVFYHNESAKGNYVYGFTQLSEVAVKALSHGINDPGVARLCVQYLSGMFVELYHLKERRVFTDQEGNVRLIVNKIGFPELPNSCITPIRQYGKKDLVIVKSLLKLLKVIDGPEWILLGYMQARQSILLSGISGRGMPAFLLKRAATLLIVPISRAFYEKSAPLFHSDFVLSYLQCSKKVSFFVSLYLIKSVKNTLDTLKPQFMKDQSEKTKKSKQSKLPLYISILLIVSLVASYFLLPSFQQFLNEAYQVLTSDDKQKISDWVSQYDWWGPVIIIFAMIAQMFLLVIPTVLLMVISVVAYGPVWGTMITLAGIFTASSAGYLIGALLGPVTVSRLIGDKTEKKIEHYVEEYGFWAVIITRISPFLSNDAISFVGGLLRMGYLKFIGATLIGILPLALLIAYLGESNDRLMNGLIWVSAVSLAVFIGYVVYDRIKKRRVQSQAGT